MATKIFLNMHVKNLPRSVEFFTQLGYTFNAQFTNEKGTCMIVGGDIFVMLLVEDYFQSFSKKAIPDTKKTSEMIVCLSAESREEVDSLVSKALKAGGAAPNQPSDQGFMYGWGFEDLDGHLWEVMYMDPAAVQG